VAHGSRSSAWLIWRAESKNSRYLWKRAGNEEEVGGLRCMVRGCVVNFGGWENGGCRGEDGGEQVLAIVNGVEKALQMRNLGEMHEMRGSACMRITMNENDECANSNNGIQI